MHARFRTRRMSVADLARTPSECDNQLMGTCAIIPTYNERNNIEPLVRAIFATVPDIRVLIVDDNSPDGTGEEVHRLQGHYPNLRLLSRSGKLGFGSAYLAGFHELLNDPSTNTAVMMDADLSHDPRYLPDMIAALKNLDVVIGSRYTDGGAVQGWSFRRRMLSLIGNRYARMVTGMPIRDCTAGFIVFRAPVMRMLLEVPMEMTGYAFLMELKHRLWRWHLRMAEIPIVFRDRTSGSSKISNGIIREGIQAPWILRRQRCEPSPCSSVSTASGAVRLDPSPTGSRIGPDA
jgi:dolichol-phosphate mannosyltransferase